MTASLYVIAGPPGPGPGERQDMQEAGLLRLAEAGVEPADIVRVDVPARGSGEEGSGAVRAEIEPAIPILQSGSLFGGRQGLLLVDAHQLTAAEAEILSDLIGERDSETAVVVILSAGRLPAKLAAVAKGGETVTIKKMWERQAAQWLEGQVRSRHLAVDEEAAGALLSRFGTDTAALGRALDQLHEHHGKITAELVLARFRNRPDEPLFMYIDAVERGSVGDSLRRLANFLTHGHPLQVVGALDNDLRRRALAAAAPDRETLISWLGSRSADRQVDRLWRTRGRVADSSLRHAQAALLRTDRVLKTEPEETHRPTLERLTVALCRWYRG